MLLKSVRYGRHVRRPNKRGAYTAGAVYSLFVSYNIRIVILGFDSPSAPQIFKCLNNRQWFNISSFSSVIIEFLHVTANLRCTHCCRSSQRNQSAVAPTIIVLVGEHCSEKTSINQCCFITILNSYILPQLFNRQM